MNSLKFRVPAEIIRRTGSNVYGEGTFQSVATTHCAIVKMETMRQQTDIAGDQSASRGHSDEMVMRSVLLFPPNLKIQVNDQIKVAGFDVRVSVVYPRYTVMGLLDHWQIEATIE